MQLIFLGSGSAFTVGGKNYHSNLLLASGKERNLLLDCGSDIRRSAFKQGLVAKDITDVYISHLHADHAGGLEWLGLMRKFDPSCTKARLYVADDIIDDLWNASLAAGMRTIKEINCTLSTYFKTSAVGKTRTFSWLGHKFKLIKTTHFYNDHLLQPCYGLFFSINNMKIFFTSDTTFTPTSFMPYFEQAHVIFHDCETLALKSGVHANYTDLITLNNHIKQKMWLYHYHPGKLPNAKKDGFRGFVKPGQAFDFNDPNTW